MSNLMSSHFTVLLGQQSDSIGESSPRHDGLDSVLFSGRLCKHEFDQSTDPCVILKYMMTKLMLVDHSGPMQRGRSNK